MTLMEQLKIQMRLKSQQIIYHIYIKDIVIIHIYTCTFIEIPSTHFFSGYLYINLFLNNQQAMVFGGSGWGRQNKVHVPFCFF